MSAVEDPELGEADLRDDRQRQRRRRETALRRDEQAPPIDAVGEHATEQWKTDEWDRLEQTEKADVEDGAREDVDLVGQRDHTDLRAGARHELAEPQEPERSMTAKR